MSAATIRTNRYAGTCELCGATVAANAGILRRGRDRQWTVTHRPPAWVGSPVSGRWVNGCPTEDAS